MIGGTGGTVLSNKCFDGKSVKINKANCLRKSVESCLLKQDTFNKYGGVSANWRFGDPPQPFLYTFHMILMSTSKTSN